MKDHDRQEIEFSYNSAHEHKDVIDIDGIITEFLWRVHISPRAWNLLDGVTVLHFFAL